MPLGNVPLLLEFSEGRLSTYLWYHVIVYIKVLSNGYFGIFEKFLYFFDLIVFYF